MKNLSAVTNDKDVATKEYVDQQAAAVLPTVTSSNNGQVLIVVNGAWTVASLPVYQGGVS